MAPEQARFLPVVAGASIYVGAVLFGAAAVRCQAFGGNSGGESAPGGNLPSSGVCIGTCRPDPGWGAVDCSVANTVDTLKVLGFELVNATTGFPVAEDLYAYTDGTASLLYGNSSSGALPSIVDAGGFQPPVQAVDLCGANDAGPGTNHVLHIVGGPFLGWGGGMGVPMSKLNGRGRAESPFNAVGLHPTLCEEPLADGSFPEVCPPTHAEYAVRVGALDVSRYDGVSFWARRGPNGQTGLRVNVGDKYTDDDMSYLAYRQSDWHPENPPEPRYCERVRECGCFYGRACSYYSNVGGYYCRNPVAASTTSTCNDVSGQSTNYCCNTTACDQPYSAYPNDLPHLADGGPIVIYDPRGRVVTGADVQFFGRRCTPHAWPDGMGSSYCFDPGEDRPPASGVERCGDHWMATVDVGTEWKFYRVPFTDLKQQGFGKKSPQLDLHAVSVVRFTWEAGYIDYWIDDVGFYRARK